MKTLKLSVNVKFYRERHVNTRVAIITEYNAESQDYKDTRITDNLSISSESEEETLSLLRRLMHVSKTRTLEKFKTLS